MPGPARRPLAERLWAKIDRGGPDECWPWRGSLSPQGYGQINAGGKYGKRLPAHRVAYEMVVAPVSPNLVLDHLCENRRCCNPAHLEPVTHQDNMLRFHGQRTTCRYGHPLDGLTRAKTPAGHPTQHRYCKTCSNERNKARARAFRDIALDPR